MSESYFYLAVSESQIEAALKEKNIKEYIGVDINYKFGMTKKIDYKNRLTEINSSKAVERFPGKKGPWFFVSVWKFSYGMSAACIEYEFVKWADKQKGHNRIKRLNGSIPKTGDYLNGDIEDSINNIRQIIKKFCKNHNFTFEELDKELPLDEVIIKHLSGVI